MTVNVVLDGASPGGVPSQPLGSSGGAWLWVLLGTFRWKEVACPAQGCLCLPFLVGTVGEEMRTAWLQMPEPISSSGGF